MGNREKSIPSVLHFVVRHSERWRTWPDHRTNNADHDTIEGTRATSRGLLVFPSSRSGMHVKLATAERGVVRPFWDSCALML